MCLSVLASARTRVRVCACVRECVCARALRTRMGGDLHGRADSGAGAGGGGEVDGAAQAGERRRAGVVGEREEEGVPGGRNPRSELKACCWRTWRPKSELFGA